MKSTAWLQLGSVGGQPGAEGRGRAATQGDCDDVGRGGRPCLESIRPLSVRPECLPAKLSFDTALLLSIGEHQLGERHSGKWRNPYLRAQALIEHLLCAKPRIRCWVSPLALLQGNHLGLLKFSGTQFLN